MQFTPKNIAAFTLGTIVANQVLERVVLQNPQTGTGIVPVGGGPLGIGLDDVAEAIVLMGSIMAVKRFVPGL